MSQKFVVSPSRSPSPTLRVAMAGGRAGDGGKLGLVRIGCQRADHRVVLGEVVVPDDEATGKPAIEAAFGLVDQACRDGAPATANAAARPSATPPRHDDAFQTAAGTGIPPSQVETMLMFWRNDQSGMTMQVHTFFFLLLKDGTFRDGLPPAAFGDIDVEAARRGEPRLWGRWTRSGGKDHLTWPDKSSRDLDDGAVRQPARPGEKLQGLYNGFSAYATGYSDSVASSEWSVQFSPDGHFLKSANRSVVGSAGGVGGAVIGDDRGTTSTMGGGNFATGRSRPGTRPAASRAGTYKLDGWMIELDYDSGVVERRPFCATGDRQSIWFEGDELSLPQRR